MSKLAESNCPFCDSDQMRTRAFLDCRDWFVIMDNHPINRGHALIVLKRHHPDMFDLSWPEWKELQEIIEHTKTYLDEGFHPNGYNLGVNCGEVAGQTVFHLHIHLIPRYKNDVDIPRGGIRNFKRPLVV